MRRITAPSLGVCLLSGVAALALSCAIAPVRSLADDGIAVVDDGAAGADRLVSYMDKDGEMREFDKDKAIDILDVDNGALNDGKTYYISRDYYIGKRFNVNGDVTLVLTDGAKLTLWSGIHCAKGNSITIAGEEGASGCIVAETSDNYHAGIGGNDEQEGGDIAICGCKVDVKSWDGAGIGGGDCGDGGNVTIRNAEVIATSRSGGAGIGGGNAGYFHDAGDGGTVHIINSKVRAYARCKNAQSSGAGIGGGGDFMLTSYDQGRGGDVYISGNSYVDAESAGDAGAFGSGDDEGNNGTLTLEPGLHVVSQDKDYKGRVAELGQQKDWCFKHHHVIVERGWPALDISGPKIGGK